MCRVLVLVALAGVILVQRKACVSGSLWVEMRQRQPEDGPEIGDLGQLSSFENCTVLGVQYEVCKAVPRCCHFILTWGATFHPGRTLSTSGAVAAELKSTLLSDM